VTTPRTLFYRCDGCGSELSNTVDLDNLPAASLDELEPPGPCHCGGTMQKAGIPALVIPEPGGDGHTWEVLELDRAE
jgi:hypothetical protein